MTASSAAQAHGYVGSAPVLILWGLAIALSPVAGLGPGNPQVPHFLLTGMVALLLTTAFIPVRLDKTMMLIGGLWLAAVFFVNIGNWLATGHRDTRFLMAIAYYFFNFSVMVGTAALAAAAPDRFRTITRLGILVALTIEAAVLFGGSGGYRSSGTFENPNQLGYWALALSACWLALKGRDGHLEIRDALVLGAATLLCMQSASRAAALGCLFLIGLAVVWYGIRPKLWPAAAVVVIALGIVGYATLDTWTGALSEQAVVERFGQKKKHDGFAERGYDRIWIYPEYLLTGAGEGGYLRFPLSAGPQGVHGGEIHSSFATVIFGYGFVGTALFGMLLWRVFSAAGMRMAALAIPLGVYGLAHQGLRTTLLWIFFGILLAKRWR